MAYLGSHTTTPIIPEFSCAGYGDVLFVEPHGKNERISVPVVQHNLATFWQRPGLIPISAGFPIPLMHAASFGVTGVYSRTPGAWLFSTPKVRIFKRNLICSELLDNSTEPSGVRIFVVNELSDRKTLIESEFSFTNPFCNRDSIFKLTHSQYSKTMELPAEAIELRTFEHENFKRKLFVRTKNSLNLCNTEASTLDKFFDFPVYEFFQVPYLNGDLVIVDSFQRLWHGTLGANFTRKKVNILTQAAAPTDCPKIVLVTDGEEIRLVDLRENRESTDTLFKVDEPAFFRTASNSTIMETMIDIHRKEEIFHLTTLPDRPFATIASSERHHFLLDHRVPGQAIITMAHSIVNGGDYCFVSPPMKDSLQDGYIYDFFSLTQTQEPQTTYWPFYLNTHDSIWSSLGPIQTLQMPQVIEKYYSTQSKKHPKNFSSNELPSYTRSICYQQLAHGAHSIGDTRALVFRQMDSGDIWYDNLIIDPNTDHPIDQEKYRKNACKKIEKFFGQSDDARHFGLRATALKADDAIVQDPQIKMKCFKILPNLSEVPSIEEMDIFEPPQDSDPFAEIGISQPLIEADELDVQDSTNEENIYTTIILKQWAKSDIAFMNYHNETIENQEDETLDASLSQTQPFHPGAPLATSTPAPKLVSFADHVEEDDDEEINWDEMDINAEY